MKMIDLSTNPPIDAELPALELGMQELEAMEAPGWWTGIGAAVSAGVSYATVYAAVSGAALT